MLTALTDLNAYRANFNVSADDLSVLGDTNGDGRVSNLDMQGLLTILKTSGGGGGLAAVPEPGTMALAFSALAVGCAQCAERRKKRPCFSAA